jgi:hypothetical protein
VFGREALTSLLLDGSGGTYTTPTGIFAYAYEVGESFRQTNVVDLKEPSRCKTVTLDFMPGTEFADSDPSNEGLFSYTGTVTIVQESADPVSQTQPFDHEGSITANVIPGEAWAVNIAQANTDGSNQNGLGFYFNGSAICD